MAKKKTKVATNTAAKTKAAPKAKPKPAPKQASRAAGAKPAKPTAPSKLPHIDPAAGKFASASAESYKPVKCSQCDDEHRLRDRRMWNVNHSQCPKCGYHVFVEVDEGTEDEVHDEAPRPADPSGQKLNYAPGTAVYVKWPPDPPRRGILRGYNRNGKPVVAMARVDHQGAYTGEVPEKGRTFEPTDIVGPCAYNQTEDERLTNALRDTPIERHESGAQHEARVRGELGEAGAVCGNPVRDPSTGKPYTGKHARTCEREAGHEGVHRIGPTGDLESVTEWDDERAGCVHYNRKAVQPTTGKTNEEEMREESEAKKPKAPRKTRSKKTDAKPDADETPPWDEPKPVESKPVEAKKPAPTPVPRQSDDTKPPHAPESKCPKCSSFLVLTRNQNQRVCSRCDYFEVARDGAWVSGDALPPAETTAPAAATDTDVDDLPMLDDLPMPPADQEDELDEEGKAPWE